MLNLYLTVAILIVSFVKKINNKINVVRQKYNKLNIN